MKTKSRLLGFFVAVMCFFVALDDSNAQVDTEKAKTNTTLSSEELNKLPGKRDFSTLLLSPDPGAALVPKVLPDNAAGFNTSIRTPPGIHTISFTTPKKDTIEVYLPNQILAGHSFTATAKLIPGPSGAGYGELKGYSIEVDGRKFNAGGNRFDVNLQDGSANNIYLKLLDPKGREVGGVEIPLWPENLSPPTPDTPTSGTSGNLMVIHCPCSGSLSPGAYVKLGGKPMQILTSTAGTVVVLNILNEPGIVELEKNVGKGVEKSRFRNLTLQVSADKTNLTKGESTQLRIVVAGLERLVAPARMTIEASGVINMSGGNSQKLAIEPSAVNGDGTYKTGNILTAHSAGTFGVTVVVAVDKEIF